MISRYPHMAERSLTEVAAEYVATLRSSANAHGQHCHPVYGRSDNMLYMMGVTFGQATTHAAIDAIFEGKSQ